MNRKVPRPRRAQGPATGRGRFAQDAPVALRALDGHFLDEQARLRLRRRHVDAQRERERLGAAFSLVDLREPAGKPLGPRRRWRRHLHRDGRGAAARAADGQAALRVDQGGRPLFVVGRLVRVGVVGDGDDDAKREALMRQLAPVVGGDPLQRQQASVHSIVLGELHLHHILVVLLRRRDVHREFELHRLKLLLDARQPAVHLDRLAARHLVDRVERPARAAPEGG